MKEQVKRRLAALNPETTIPEHSVEDDIRKRIPTKWREKVNEILGKDFECEVDDSSGGDFLIKIFVPEKWDCRVGDEKRMAKRDMRAGLIRRATDVSDVEKWCKLIKSNILKTYPNFTV